MSIRIGHASGDENGGAHGGKAGDQTGREVREQEWYAGNWSIVLRPKSSDVAEKMATACEVLARSNLVGYDQWERNTLWDELEKVNWKPEALKTKCETDCSAFMTACARVAGIDVPRVALGGGKYNAPVTQNMRSLFSQTGAFELLTDSKYLTTDKYLKRGDVLVRESGHTAMALENGSTNSGSSTQKPQQNTQEQTVSKKECKATEVAQYFDKSIAGAYKCTAYALFVRNGAGISKKLLTTIKKDKEVRCYGYYNYAGLVKWLYVQFEQDGVIYTAYASERYLKKVVGK